MNQRAVNRLREAIFFLETNKEGQALVHIDEARALLIPPRPPCCRPEDDPNRSPSDRAVWRQARG